MLQRDGESDNQVQGCQFTQQVRFALFGIRIVTLFDMNPDMPGQVPRCLAELSPVFAAIDVSLVGARCPERDAQANHEAEDGKEKVRDNERMNEFRDACDESRPGSDNGQGYYHSGCDATMHAQEIW